MGIEKWTIKEDSLMDLEEYGWTCDILIDGKDKLDVYAATKGLCLSRAKKICKVNEMEAALKEIKIVSKRLNLWVGIDTIIDPILKDLDS